MNKKALIMGGFCGLYLRHVAFNVYKVGSSNFRIGVGVENDPKMIRNTFTSGPKWNEWTKI